jgi:hypothetical protein
MNLIILEKDFTVCRLSSESVFPQWAMISSFLSISRTVSELSIVCESSLVPGNVKSETGWRILKVEGTLDFGLTGILASIINPLALARISIFAVSTFDTDYVLVKQDLLALACDALRANGFKIIS